MIKVSGLYKRFGDASNGFTAVNRISFEVNQGDFVTLLGPSGCGKTTTLRLLAGLERPNGGSIEIDGECMCSGDTKIFQPTNRRPVGMVFQSYAIWPHMTVAGNVGFPLKVARPRVPKSEMAERVDAALKLVGLDHLSNRMSTDLSGGQQQRVALARALVRQPKVLLLDEPLSNLDAELRERMRDEIREVQQRLGITTIFVTHDQAEALAMSDQVIVMNAGDIVESGLPQEIYSFPRRSFTAKFLGVSNTFSGVVTSREGEVATVDTAQGTLDCRAPAEVCVGDEVLVAVRPDSFRIWGEKPDEPAWTGTVLFGTYHGDCWIYHVDVGGQSIKVKATGEKIGLAYGDSVYLVPEPGGPIVTYDGALAQGPAPVATASAAPLAGRVEED